MAQQQFSEIEEYLRLLKERREQARRNIFCGVCGKQHPKAVMKDKPTHAARWCGSCRVYHPANEGDVWLESKFLGTKYHIYARIDNVVVDITEWGESSMSHRTSLLLSPPDRSLTLAHSAASFSTGYADYCAQRINCIHVLERHVPRSGHVGSWVAQRLDHAEGFHHWQLGIQRFQRRKEEWRREAGQGRLATHGRHARRHVGRPVHAITDEERRTARGKGQAAAAAAAAEEERRERQKEEEIKTSR